MARNRNIINMRSKQLVDEELEKKKLSQSTRRDVISRAIGTEPIMSSEARNISGKRLPTLNMPIDTNVTPPDYSRNTFARAERSPLSPKMPDITEQIPSPPVIGSKPITTEMLRDDYNRSVGDYGVAGAGKRREPVKVDTEELVSQGGWDRTIGITTKTKGKPAEALYSEKFPLTFGNKTTLMELSYPEFEENLKKNGMPTTFAGMNLTPVYKTLHYLGKASEVSAGALMDSLVWTGGKIEQTGQNIVATGASINKTIVNTLKYMNDIFRPDEETPVWMDKSLDAYEKIINYSKDPEAGLVKPLAESKWARVNQVTEDSDNNWFKFTMEALSTAYGISYLAAEMTAARGMFAKNVYGLTGASADLYKYGMRYGVSAPTASKLTSTLLNFMKPRVAEGVKASIATPVAEYQTMMHGAKVMAGHGMITGQGSLAERAEAVAFRLAYTHTPYLARATGLTGLSVKGADFLWNTFITFPQYIKVAKDLGNGDIIEGMSNPDYWIFASTQAMLDLYFVRTTKGLRGAEYERALATQAKKDGIGIEEAREKYSAVDQAVTRVAVDPNLAEDRKAILYDLEKQQEALRDVYTNEKRYQDLIQHSTDVATRQLRGAFLFADGSGREGNAIRFAGGDTGDERISTVTRNGQRFGIAVIPAELDPRYNSVDAIWIPGDASKNLPSSVMFNINFDKKPGMGPVILGHEMFHDAVDRGIANPYFYQLRDVVSNLARTEPVQIERVGDVVGEIMTTTKFWDAMKGYIDESERIKMQEDFTRNPVDDTLRLLTPSQRLEAEILVPQMMREYYTQGQTREVFNLYLKQEWDRMQYNMSTDERIVLADFAANFHEQAGQFYYRADRAVDNMQVSKYKGKHGGEVVGMKIQQAIQFFGSDNQMRKIERDELGIMEWLKGIEERDPNYIISKEEIKDYVDANKLMVIEQTWGALSKPDLPEVPSDKVAPMGIYNKLFTNLMDGVFELQPTYYAGTVVPSYDNPRFPYMYKLNYTGIQEKISQAYWDREYGEGYLDRAIIDLPKKDRDKLNNIYGTTNPEDITDLIISNRGNRLGMKKILDKYLDQYNTTIIDDWIKDGMYDHVNSWRVITLPENPTDDIREHRMDSRLFKLNYDHWRDMGFSSSKLYIPSMPEDTPLIKELTQVGKDQFTAMDMIVKNITSEQLLEYDNRMYVVKDGKYISTGNFYLTQKEVDTLFGNIMKELDAERNIDTDSSIIKALESYQKSMGVLDKVNLQISSASDASERSMIYEDFVMNNGAFIDRLIGEKTILYQEKDGTIGMKYNIHDLYRKLQEGMHREFLMGEPSPSNLPVNEMLENVTSRANRDMTATATLYGLMDTSMEKIMGIKQDTLLSHPMIAKLKGWELINMYDKLELVLSHAGNVLSGVRDSNAGYASWDRDIDTDDRPYLLTHKEYSALREKLSNMPIEDMLTFNYEKVYGNSNKLLSEYERKFTYDLPLNVYMKRTADQLRRDINDDVTGYFNTYITKYLTDHALYHQLLQRKPEWFTDVDERYQQTILPGSPNRWANLYEEWGTEASRLLGINRGPVTTGHHAGPVANEKIPLSTVDWRERGALPDSYGVFVLKLPEDSKYSQGPPKHSLPQNTMAHVRYQAFNTFKDGEEKKIFYIDEFQSDWAIAVRKQNQYRVLGQSEMLAAEYNGLISKLGYSSDITPESSEAARRRRIMGLSGGVERDVPYIIGTMRGGAQKTFRLSPETGDRIDFSSGITDFPFRNETHMLAMKRIVSFAAEKGFDGVAFSSGLQQSMRWNKSNWYQAMDVIINNIDKLSDSERTTLAGHVEKMASPIVGHEDAKFIYDSIVKMQVKLLDVVDKVSGEPLDKNYVGDANRRYAIEFPVDESKLVGDAYLEKMYDQIVLKDMSKYLKKQFGVELTSMKLENMQYPTGTKGEPLQTTNPGFWITEKMHEAPALFHRSGDAEKDPFIFYKSAGNSNEYVTGNEKYKIFKGMTGEWVFNEIGKGAIGSYKTLEEARLDAELYLKTFVPEARDIKDKAELVSIAPSLGKMADELIGQGTKSVYSAALSELKMRLDVAQYALGKGKNVKRYEQEIRIAEQEIQNLYKWREDLQSAEQRAEQDALPPQLRNQELIGKPVQIESAKADAPGNKVEEVKRAHQQSRSINEILSVWNETGLTNKQKRDLTVPILEEINRKGARLLLERIKDNNQFPNNHIREEVGKMFPDLVKDPVNVAKEDRSYKNAHDNFARDVELMRAEIERLQAESAKNTRSGNREYFKGESYWSVGKKLSGGIISLVKKLNKRVDRFVFEWGHKYSEFEIQALRDDLAMVGLKAEQLQVESKKAMAESGAYHQMSWHELRNQATSRGVSAKAGITRDQIEMQLEKMDAEAQGKKLWDVLKAEARDRGIAIGGKTLNELWSTLRKARVKGDKPIGTVTTVTPEGIKYEEIKTDEEIVVRAGTTASTGTRLPVNDMSKKQIKEEALTRYGIDLSEIKELDQLRSKLRELRNAEKRARKTGQSPDIPVVEVVAETKHEDPKAMGNKKIAKELIEVFEYDAKTVNGWVREKLVSELKKARAKVASNPRPVPIQVIEDVIIKTPEPIRPVVTPTRMPIKDMSKNQIKTEAQERYGIDLSKNNDLEALRAELKKLRAEEKRMRKQGDVPVIPSDQLVDDVQKQQAQQVTDRDAQNREILERFKVEVKNQDIYTVESLERRIATLTGKNIPYADEVIKVAQAEIERRNGLPVVVDLTKFEERLNQVVGARGLSGVVSVMNNLLENKRKYTNWRDAADVVARTMDDMYSERFNATVEKVASLRKQYLDRGLPLHMIEEYLRQDYRLANKLRTEMKKLRKYILPTVEELQAEHGRVSLLPTDTVSAPPSQQETMRYPHLTVSQNKEISKLDNTIRKLSAEKRRQKGVNIEEYVASTDPDKTVYDYLYKLNDDALRDGLPMVPQPFLQSLKLYLDNRTGEITHEDLRNIKQAHLYYIKEKSEEGKLIMSGRAASLPAVREEILEGSRNIGKHELDEVLSPSIHKSGKLKHFLATGQMSLARLVQNLDGSTWNAKKILRGETMSKLRQITVGAVQDAFHTKFQFMHGELAKFQEVISQHMDRGDDLLRDSNAMSPKAKDINWRYIKLEGGQLREDGTINNARKKIELSPGEIMMLYMLCKNPEVRAEIINGGLRITAHKTKFARQNKQHEANVYKITENDLNKIVGYESKGIAPMLTKGQKERADYMFRRYNSVIKDFVNQWSYRGMGIIAATQDIYAPMRRSMYDSRKQSFTIPVVGWKVGITGNELPDVRTSDFGVKTLETMGILQQRQYMGKPIMVEDAYRTFMRYVNQASDLPFMEVYRNYDKLFSDSGFKANLDKYGGKIVKNQELREAMQVHMNRIATYQAKETNDIQQATTDIFVRFQQAKLGLNPWVIPIQGISLLYGFNEMPSKYMPMSFVDLLATPFTYNANKEIFDEMKKYNPTNALHRFVGGAMSRSVGEIYDYDKLRPMLLGDNMTLKDKIKSGRWVTGGIRQVDSMVMLELWKSAKKWVDAERPDLKTKDEKLQLVSKIYDHIVETNQPTYATHTRGEITTSKDPLLRSVTMFISQRNKIFNELVHAPIDYMRSDKEPEDLAKLISTMLIYGVAGPAMLTLRDEARDWWKMRPRNWANRMFKTTQYLLGSWAIGGDAVNAIMSKMKFGEYSQQGDLNNVVLQFINDTTDAATLFVQAYDQYRNDPVYQSGPKEGDLKWTKTLWRAVVKSMEIADVSTAFPVVNAYQNIIDAGRRVSPELQFALDHVGKAPDPTTMYEKYWEHWESGNTKMMERQLYLIISPTTLGRDLKAVQSSFATYHDKGKLPIEAWEDTQRLYQKLARENGWSNAGNITVIKTKTN